MAWDPGSLPSCPSPPFYKETVSGLAPAPPSLFSSPPPQLPLAKSLASLPTMRVNELNKKIKISFAPIRRCTKCSHGISLREGGEAQEGGKDRESKSEEQRSLAGHPQPLASEGLHVLVPNRASHTASGFSGLSFCTAVTDIHPGPAFSCHSNVAPPRPIHPALRIVLCAHWHTRGNTHPHDPWQPQAQHLVDGRVDHHPSDDLCLVGHLRLLLEGWRNC